MTLRYDLRFSVVPCTYSCVCQYGPLRLGMPVMCPKEEEDDTGRVVLNCSVGVKPVLVIAGQVVAYQFCGKHVLFYGMSIHVREKTRLFAKNGSENAVFGRFFEIFAVP